MPTSVLPFLMFQGEAEAALAFYLAVFPDAHIDEVRENPATDAMPASKLTRLTLHGQSVLVFDSPVKHGFGFTPSFSFFVTCESEEEVRRLSEMLKQEGAEMMPAGSYGFSTLFAWVSDRFGVSWQLNYP